jgi:hypothetical protein
LQDFCASELPAVEQIRDMAGKAVECWLGEGVDIAMTQYNKHAVEPDD